MAPKDDPDGVIDIKVHMGVGSSGVAAVNMKRRFLGFDNDERYVKAASERIVNVCGMKVVPIKRGEPQPFLLDSYPTESLPR